MKSTQYQYALVNRGPALDPSHPWYGEPRWFLGADVRWASQLHRMEYP